MKTYLKSFFTLFLLSLGLFGTVGAEAATAYDMITSAINFTDVVAALGTIFGGLILVGMFLWGGNAILGLLGMNTKKAR